MSSGNGSANEFVLPSGGPDVRPIWFVIEPVVHPGTINGRNHIPGARLLPGAQVHRPVQVHGRRCCPNQQLFEECRYAHKTQRPRDRCVEDDILTSGEATSPI